jgi:hypothetical protein
MSKMGGFISENGGLLTRMMLKICSLIEKLKIISLSLFLFVCVLAKLLRRNVAHMQK